MRKLFGKKNNELGAIGIGAMIVFIAMVLVAGVAASVLISTSNSIQSQAQKTGAQTTREVSSGLTVFQVLGEVWVNGTTYNDITHLAVTVSAKPGSDKIDLNNTYILMSDGSQKALLTYGGYNNLTLWDSSVNGDIFASITWANLNSEKFGIGILQDYDGSMSQTNPVINRGDKAVIFIHTNTSMVFGSAISERTEVFGRIIPEIGAPGVISFTAPKAYSDTVYVLQ